MRRLLPLAAPALLACGTVAPASGPATTTSATTGEPTTTSTSSTGTIPTTSAATTTLSFIIQPDSPPRIECDIFDQDCRVGEKCVPWSLGGGTVWDATKCVPVTGDGAPGDPCTAPEGPHAGIDDCGAASICWYVDPDNHGTCVAQCTLVSDQYVCPPAHSCATGDDTFLALCLPWCDPLAQDCPDDRACLPTADDTFGCVLDASGAAGQLNDPCEYTNTCDPGLTCLPPATVSATCDQAALGCCTPFCQLPDAPCPNPDQQCLPWFDPMQPIPPGYESVGVCAIPT